MKRTYNEEKKGKEGMDGFLIVAIVFTCFLVLGVVIVAVFVSNKDRDRKSPEDHVERRRPSFPSFSYPIDYGTEGELLTMQELTKFPGYKKVFHSCYIPTTPGHTTEADIIMVHECGVFVLECKNYSGWISGRGEEEKWIQCQERYGEIKKKEFYNPIKQNDTHLIYLDKFIDQDVPYYSYIVFVGDCLIQDIELTSNEACVCKLKDLIENMKMVYEDYPDRLSKEEVDAIALKIQTIVNIDQKTYLQHQIDVENHKSQNGY